MRRPWYIAWHEGKSHSPDPPPGRSVPAQLRPFGFRAGHQRRAAPHRQLAAGSTQPAGADPGDVACPHRRWSLFPRADHRVLRQLLRVDRHPHGPRAIRVRDELPYHRKPDHAAIRAYVHAVQKHRDGRGARDRFSHQVSLGVPEHRRGYGERGDLLLHAGALHLP